MGAGGTGGVGGETGGCRSGGRGVGLVGRGRGWRREVGVATSNRIVGRHSAVWLYKADHSDLRCTLRSTARVRGPRRKVRCTVSERSRIGRRLLSRVRGTTITRSVVEVFAEGARLQRFRRDEDQAGGRIALKRKVSSPFLMPRHVASINGASQRGREDGAAPEAPSEGRVSCGRSRDERMFDEAVVEERSESARGRLLHRDASWAVVG